MQNVREDSSARRRPEDIKSSEAQVDRRAQPGRKSTGACMPPESRTRVALQLESLALQHQAQRSGTVTPSTRSIFRLPRRPFQQGQYDSDQLSVRWNIGEAQEFSSERDVKM